MQNRNQEEKVSNLMKQFYRFALSTISIEMIPDVTAADVMWVRETVMEESRW